MPDENVVSLPASSWDEAQRQAAFFDRQRNRYAVDAILRPPYHTQLELAQILRRIDALKLGPDDTIVDFGAGSGRVSIPLLQRGHPVVAVDVSEQSLAELRALAESLGLTGLTTSTTLPTGDFGAIVGADILHHVDMEEYLPGMHAALQPGGAIVFSEPGALNPAWYVYLPLFYDWSVERGVMTCTSWNLSRSLRRHGFTDITLTGLGLAPRSLLSHVPAACRLNDELGAVPGLNQFAYRYIVEARKASH
ncbi:MAG TPA: class I SAM-dependent methyltransferase [Chloroflexota bacterium]|nr:class I SAM-dependent methyltransferase [Chloroflexota bacterium]